MKKLLCILGITMFVSACGGVEVDQKALKAANSQCTDNGSIYSVTFSEGSEEHLMYIYVACKDGTSVKLNKADW